MKLKIMVAVLALVAEVAFGQSWMYMYDSLLDQTPIISMKSVDVRITSPRENPDYEFLVKRGIAPRAHETPYILDAASGSFVVLGQDETPEEAKARFFVEDSQRITSECQDVMEELVVFKWIYETHFGKGSLTNENLTENLVVSYFTMRRVMQTGATTDGSDIMALSRGFATIKGITRQNNIWAVPWDLVPDISGVEVESLKVPMSKIMSIISKKE